MKLTPTYGRLAMFSLLAEIDREIDVLKTEWQTPRRERPAQPPERQKQKADRQKEKTDAPPLLMREYPYLAPCPVRRGNWVYRGQACAACRRMVGCPSWRNLDFEPSTELPHNIRPVKSRRVH